MRVSIVRTMAVAMVLFLCPVPSRGMEPIQGINAPFEEINKTTYNMVNRELREIVFILQSKLKTDAYHTFKSVIDGGVTKQCKLSAMSSPLIAGDGNKPLRNDLRCLLYKPWTDPYYGNHFSQKDFTLLSILKG